MSTYVRNILDHSFYTFEVMTHFVAEESSLNITGCPQSCGIFFFFEKSWEIHGIFASCILENSIWLLLNTLLEVFVAESIKLTLLVQSFIGWITEVLISTFLFA